MLTSNLKNKIISSYASHKNLELEARFGIFRQKRFSPGVSRQIFNRIKAYFDEKAPVSNVKTTDYIMGKVRKSIVNPENEDHAEIVWITKRRLWSEDIPDYNIRYSMSSEDPISPIDDNLFNPEIIREKNRSSYSVFGDSVRIDITLVNMVGGNKDEVTYEVEIELLDPKKLDNFEKAIVVTTRLVLDTIVLYTESMKRDVMNRVNSILGSKMRDRLDHYPIVQARNLKLKDMVYGGLIGNSETTYSVTHKADGQRKLLFFSESGIWLLSAPFSLMRVSETTIPEFNGTILDGEMIPIEKRKPGSPEARVWYLAFDALAWNMDKTVMSEPHVKRMFYAQSVADKLKGNILHVNTKSFKNLSTPQEFFATMREMFREQIHLTYQQDGFMFTPQNTVYNPHSDKNPLFRRNLSAFPDICKWKPKEELTIDFLIKWKADINSPIGRSLELYSGEKGGLRQFLESEGDSSSELTLNLPNDTVVEYGYDYERKMLIPTRIRHDKTKPNAYEIALDVWNDISNPIEKDALEGETFLLLRRYHNRIKRELFDSVSKEKYLLDIGSGRGGDVFKWKNFDKILAVEPNGEHILELQRRLKEAEMSDKVFILQSGGEETEKIRQAADEWFGKGVRVDVISMMLSMTFFWQSSSLVDALVSTIVFNIKEDGKFIFLTMDGDLVEQTFEPPLKTGLVLDKLKLGPATLTYFGDKIPKELHIDIRDSIVSDQTEWLVRLDDLRVRMKKYGWEFIQLEKADKEKFLTEEEIIMTQMYTYGVMKGVGEKLPNLEVAKTYPPITSPKPLFSLPPFNPITPIVEPLKEPSSPPTIRKPKMKGKVLGILPMNKVQEVSLTWWDEKVVRIGAIGDGSCFFHSLFNAYLKLYQTNPDIKFRKKFVRNFRKDISLALALPDPKAPDRLIYDTVLGGQFVRLFEQQKMGLDTEDLMGEKIDFSLSGLAKFFDSDSYVGDETYGYVAELLGIDIFVMRLTSEDLYVHLDTSTPDSEKRTVIISGDGTHFETIGVERNGLIQTFFEFNDPFVLKIKNLR